MWKTCTIVSNSMLKWLYFYSVVVYCFKLLSRWEISTSICQNVLTFIVIKLRPRGHKSACCSCEKSTDHCMTDARKYCRMSYLLMLSKAESEKWSWIHIRNRINTKTWSLPEGYTLPKFDRHLSLRSWVILWTHTHRWLQYLLCLYINACRQLKFCYSVLSFFKFWSRNTDSCLKVNPFKLHTACLLLKAFSSCSGQPWLTYS